MKALRTVLFILAMVCLTTQAVRHIYVRFLEPRTSVLDKYEQTETKKAILKARSLGDLVAQYDVAKKRFDELESEKKKAEEDKTKDERDVFRDKFRELHEVEYDRESELRSAIGQWEQRSKEIHELRVFWLFGFAFFLIGGLLQARGRAWLGISLIIPGVAEMIWWTSPSFGFGGSPVEFDRLLINKLVFTLITLLLLIIGWCVTERGSVVISREQSMRKE